MDNARFDTQQSETPGRGTGYVQVMAIPTSN